MSIKDFLEEMKKEEMAKEKSIDNVPYKSEYTDLTHTEPSYFSLNQLCADIDLALGNFSQRNPKVAIHRLYAVIWSVMLSYSYSWVSNSGNQDKFVDAMTNEAKNFVALIEIGKKLEAEQQAVKTEKVNV